MAFDEFDEFDPELDGDLNAFDRPAPPVSPEELERLHEANLRQAPLAIDDALDDEEDEALFPPVPRPPAAPQALIDQQCVERFYASVVDDCADRLMMLGRNRAEWPWRDRPNAERQVYAQLAAIAHAHPRAPRALMRWLEDEGEDERWAWWAAAQVIETNDKNDVIAPLLEAQLPEDNEVAAGIYERHLATGTPIAERGKALLSSSSPVVRAAGIELMSYAGALTEEDLLAWIETGEATVCRAAVDALLRTAELSRAPDAVTALLGHQDAAVASAAAYAVTVWRGHEAFTRIREGGPLLDKLGSRCAALFPLAAEAEHVEVLQRVVTAFPVDAATLLAIGRYGQPTVWSFLLHYLGDPNLRDAAERALVTLYGPLLPAMATPSDWEAAISELDLDPAVRYRRGQPWSPAVVADELAEGALSRDEMLARIDELRARTGIDAAPSLMGWGDAAQAAVTAFAERARVHAQRFSAGSWSWR